MLNLAFYGQVFVLGLFFQRVRGEDALTAGLAFLPMTGLIARAMLATPRLIARLGSTATIVAGQLCCVVAVLGAQAIDRSTPWWVLALLLRPMGLGGGISFPPLTARAMAGVPEHLTGTASGAFNATRQLGAAVGVAIFGGLLGAASGPAVAAMHATQLVCATLLTAAIGLACWAGHPAH